MFAGGFLPESDHAHASICFRLLLLMAVQFLQLDCRGVSTC
jgi:hypothetical protein